MNLQLAFKTLLYDYLKFAKGLPAVSRCLLAAFLQSAQRPFVPQPVAAWSATSEVVWVFWKQFVAHCAVMNFLNRRCVSIHVHI